MDLNEMNPVLLVATLTQQVVELRRSWRPTARMPKSRLP